jgi:Rieske 2Fe-2S family protein
MPRSASCCTRGVTGAPSRNHSTPITTCSNSISGRCFTGSGFFAGLEAELQQPGDWFTFDIAATSVVVLRDRDGSVRAFLNTCRHRGSRICSGESGQAVRLICPYHQWTYDLDGRLIGAAMMPSDFDRSAHGLRLVHVQTLGGTIYVCLAKTAPDFADVRRAIEPALALHDLGGAKVAAKSTIVVKGN